MHILHVVQRYLPAVGGAELYMAAMCERLAAVGHEVTVVCSDARSFELFWQPDAERVPETESWINGVRVLRFPVHHLPLSPTSYHALRRLLWLASRYRLPLPNVAHFTPLLPTLWRWLPTAPPVDLVVGTNVAYESVVQAGLQLSRRRGVPFVLHPLVHLGAGDQPGRDTIGSFYTMRQQNELVRQSDVVVVQTAVARDYYIQQGVAPEKLHVVGTGVDEDALLNINPQPLDESIEGDVIFSLSALCYDKGTIHLVEAVRQLRENGRSDLTLVLGGKPLADMVQFLQTLPPNSDQWLRLVGSISEGQKRFWLQRCNLFAMPSRTDSFGIVYLEAWLHQKPVVAAQAWGVNSVVTHGQDGLLIPFGNVPRLADALAELLDNPDKAKALGKQGEQTVQQHTWAKKFPQILQIYEHIGTQHAAP